MKKSLVLLHGWGVNSQIWNSVLPLLSPHFDLHVLDLPGYGNSNWNSESTLDQVVENVLAQAPEFGIWIGWSLGASVVMKAAIDAPQRFEKIQLISPTPRFMVTADWHFGMQREPLQHLENSFEKNYKKGLQKFLLMQTTHPKPRDFVKRQLVNLNSASLPDDQAWKSSLNILTQTDLRQDVDGWKPENLQVVFGIHDKIISPQASRWIGSKIPTAEAVELDAGHLPFLDDQKNWLQHTLHFAGVN